MAQTSTDRELLLRSQNGDQESFRRLVEMYTPRVYGLVRNLVRSQTEAEDVTQEVFFKVYRKLDTFREDSAFYTWLYRVAVNAATDWLKKKRQDRALQLDDFGAMSLADDADGPDQNVRTKDLRKEVRMAMGELSEKFRTILVLRELEGLQYEEISAVLQISKGTVESRIFRARAKLKIELERRRLGA
ncbi:MAG: sigma-70 family RNA polymerase sigma factor [Planctomycetota bacterium]|nr:sigma-70 family RNA polymerase sigma factor [Planctomycetota bacterium]